MADNNKVEVQIGSNVSGLVRGMSEAGSAVRDGVGAMNKHLGNLTGMLKGVGAAFTAVGTVLGGGVLFREAINETVEWARENERLARTLGITTEEASVLNDATGDVLATTEQYVRGVQMLTRQIGAGGKGFKELGIEIRDASGNLRPTTELMSDAIERLNSLKAGTDRNVAAQKIFGRGWMEIDSVLGLTKDAMDRARVSGERLGLTTGPEAVAQARAYRIAMDQVHDVFLALKLHLGNALLPTLTRLGQFFADSGPAMVEAFKVAIRAAITLFNFLSANIRDNVAQLKAWYVTAQLVFTGIAAGWKALKEGDMVGAGIAMNGMAALVGMAWEKSAEDSAAAWAKFKADTQALWNPPAAKVSDAPGAGGSLPEAGPSDAQRAAGERAFQALKLKQRKDTHDQIVALLNAEEAAARDHDAQRLAAARLKAEEEEAFYGKGSAEAIRAMQHVADVERDINNRRRENSQKLAAAREEYDLAVIGSEEDAIRQRYELGEISLQQELEQLQRLEQVKYEIRRKGIEDQLADDQLSASQRALLLLELERLEHEHAGRIAAFRRQETDQMRVEVDGFVNTWTQSWAQGIEAMLNGTMKLSQGVAGIFRSLRSAVLQTLAQMVTDWIAMELKKFVFFVAQKIKQLVVQQSTDRATQASVVATAMTEVAAKGASAAAGAASSAAAIPWVGWAIAIPAALAVLAGVLAFRSNIGSAAGGWDIGLENPMAQLHKKEMVLPAHLAERIRNMTDEPKGGPVNVTFAPQLIDARGVDEWWNDNSGNVVRTVRQAIRDGRLS